MQRADEGTWNDRLKKNWDSSNPQTKSRVGDRYFIVDAGYDKAVYENTWYNWIRIIISFFFLYISYAILWLTCLQFGMHEPDYMTYGCCGVFVVSVIVSSHWQCRLFSLSSFLEKCPLSSSAEQRDWTLSAKRSKRRSMKISRRKRKERPPWESRRRQEDNLTFKVNSQTNLCPNRPAFAPQLFPSSFLPGISFSDSLSPFASLVSTKSVEASTCQSQTSFFLFYSRLFEEEGEENSLSCH